MKALDPVLTWARQGLRRQFLLVAAGLVGLTSVLFLGLITQQYRTVILRAQEQASVSVNLLLQAALENAMIKRDIDGLQTIVSRLGAQDGIVGVMIANPAGEVRFSSYSDPPKRVMGDSIDTALGTTQRQVALQRLDSGESVMRSVNPVSNQAPCAQCHGSVEDHPVNGLLIVDYETQGLIAAVWRGALLLAALGVAVLLMLELGLWAALNRIVLRRVRRLDRSSQALAAGNLSVRAATEGSDELARLGRNFDTMAAQLQTRMKELNLSYSGLQRLIDAIPDGVRVIDGQFRILMVNAAYEAQIGAVPGSCPGHLCHISSHNRDTPCVSTLVRCPVAEILHQGGGAMTCSHSHTDANGAVVDVEVAAAPATLFFDGQEQQVVVESIRDLDRDLAISHRQRLSELGAVAAGVAHEVSNPLSSILMAMQFIEGHEALPDDVRRYVEIVKREVGTCQKMTESLLRLSAHPTTELEAVDMADVIASVATLLRFDAEGAGVEIDCQTQGCPTVMARDSDMRNLVFNLALNGLHAMPDGGRLTLACTGEDAHLKIQISDTGVGIPERDRAHILQPFWTRRADGTRGRGLGLPISLSIVKGLGGTLTFESSVGKGTTFWITLPSTTSKGDAS